MSNSTAPTYETGDILLLNRQVPFSQYKVGDGIVYFNPVIQEVVIHRIYGIKVINGSYYFAIKGDSNPQPDTVAQTGDIHNYLLSNKTVTWTTFYNSSTPNPTAPYIAASYYPANQVIYGKVIFKIPVLGWLFVPFNSPLTDPLHILPLSLFSMFTIYYAILVIITFFALMSKANSELRRFLNSLTIKPNLIAVPTHLNLRNFYSLVLYPLILFLLIFFSSVPVPVNFNDTIVLESSGQESLNNINYTHLQYKEIQTINSATISQNNVTNIGLLFTNNSNIINMKITKNETDFGQNINSGENFNLSTVDSYQLTIDANSMFVTNSSKAGVPELGRFLDYMVPISSIRKPPVGLMTQNVFLEVNNGTYNNSLTYSTYLNFSFIQDLIQYQWNVKAQFSQDTGYLLYLQVFQSESLWGVPETVGMIIICLGVILIYNIMRRQFQRMFDERQQKIINSQKSNKGILATIPAASKEELKPQTISESTTQNEPPPSQPDTTTSTESKDDKNKKKLSWEEYQKLENKE